MAPRRLDAVVALPLVLIDLWAATVRVEMPSNEAPAVQLLLLVLVLTWVLYVLAACWLIWRLLLRSDNEVESG